VDWGVISRCSQDYQIERVHLEEDEMIDLFGKYEPQVHNQRAKAIRTWLQQVFKDLLANTGTYRLGFDVAASGKGDLCCIYIDRKVGSLYRLAGLFTCRTEDWEFIKSSLFFFLGSLPALKAAGDETGLGRQICWEASAKFNGIFTGVNFARSKADIGFTLMNQLTAGEKIFPMGERDVPADFYAIQKRYQGKRWTFSEGSNAHNPNSHCDIAWAGGLASFAEQGDQEGFYFPE